MSDRHDARRLVPPALVLAIVAAAFAALLTLLADLTRERAATHRESWLTQRLDALVPPSLYDNDMLSDRIEVLAPASLGTTEPVSVYRARRAGRPTAVVLRPVAPDGYAGEIELLVAIAYDGSLLGVQVLSHNETPGLGDAFERREPEWLERFRGRSLEDPPQRRWAVRKDGGEFDQFTGATITARAIVKAVRSTLEFYGRNRDKLFADD